MKRRFTFASLIMAMLLLSIAAVPTAAQEDRTIVQLGLSGFQLNFFGDILEQDVIPQFEAENPSIRVELVEVNVPFAVDDDIEAYLDDFERLAMRADLFLLPQNTLTPEAVAAGYLLDITSIAQSDPELNTDDFYPATLDAYRLNDRLWGLPITASVVMLFYDPLLFDEAGLAYPNENWTIYDFDNVIRQLTEFDADGEVVDEVLMDGEFAALSALVLGLSGDDLYDDTTLPFTPAFDNPQLAEIMDVWANLYRDGYLSQEGGNTRMIFVGGENPDFQVPLILGTQLVQSFSRRFDPQLQTEVMSVAAPLPVSGGSVVVEGIGISGGTIAPEAAYTLARYLTQNPVMQQLSIGGQPARRSLVGADTGVNEDNIILQNTALTPEVQAINEMALETGLTQQDRLFSSALNTALERMLQEDISAADALEQLEEEVTARLEIALARSGQTITVNAPDLGPQLAPGERELVLGVGSLTNPLPNQDQWDELATRFAANEPGIGAVTIEADFPRQLAAMAEQYACFIMPNNVVQTDDLSPIIPVGPLLTSDPNFDRADYLPGLLDQVSLNGTTWGLPLSINPASLHYSLAFFDRAGLPYPQGGWSVTEFEQALISLATVMTEDEGEPLQINTFDNSALLQLIAAYGGFPVDYTTNPVTINYTDPANVAAIREVLDLAKDGLISYGGFTAGDTTFTLTQDAPIYINFGGGVTFFTGDDGEAATFDSDPQVSFPAGSGRPIVAYSTAVGYISANSIDVEACYRLLAEIAQTPGLVDGMPVTYSNLSDGGFRAQVGEETTQFYEEIADRIAQPDVNTLPTTTGLGRGLAGSIIESYWLNRAFDRYVLEDADLEAELLEAEQFTREYQTCVAETVPEDTEAQGPGGGNLFEVFTQCASAVDPTYTR